MCLTLKEDKAYSVCEVLGGAALFRDDQPLGTAVFDDVDSIFRT